MTEKGGCQHNMKFWKGVINLYYTFLECHVSGENKFPRKGEFDRNQRRVEWRFLMNSTANIKTFRRSKLEIEMVRRILEMKRLPSGQH